MIKVCFNKWLSPDQTGPGGQLQVVLVQVASSDAGACELVPWRTRAAGMEAEWTGVMSL